MHTLSPLHRQKDSGTFGLHRDAATAFLLDTHPATAAMLVRFGWFPNTKKAHERLRLLIKRKQVAKVGAVWRNVGSPQHVYCHWRPKRDKLLHEVELTEVCLRLSTTSIHRGPAITDRALRPDAEVWINQELFYLELDRWTMPMGQMKRRFAKYEGCGHRSLWVCADEKRLEEMRRRAATVQCSALFTTYAEALADPEGSIWRDVTGIRVCLPRARAIPEPEMESAASQPIELPPWLAVDPPLPDVGPHPIAEAQEPPPRGGL